MKTLKLILGMLMLAFVMSTSTGTAKAEWYRSYVSHDCGEMNPEICMLLATSVEGPVVGWLADESGQPFDCTYYAVNRVSSFGTYGYTWLMAYVLYYNPSIYCQDQQW